MTNSNFLDCDGYLICDECFEDEYIHCSICGEFKPSDGSITWEEKSFWETWCRDCYEEINKEI